MSEEKKADLEGAFAEFAHEVWLAIKQGADGGEFKSVIDYEGVKYGLIVKYDLVENL